MEMNMKENGTMDECMVMALFSIIKEENLQGSLKMIAS